MNKGRWTGVVDAADARERHGACALSLFGFALAHLLLPEPVAEAILIGAILIGSGTFVGLLADRHDGQ